MSAPSPFERLLRPLREGARRKRIRAAHAWPQAGAKITQWKVIQADPASGGSAMQRQVEASFYFMLNDDICGGYVRSVPMVEREAARLATGEATLIVRYNFNDPDELCVIAEDNAGKFPFDLISG